MLASNFENTDDKTDWQLNFLKKHLFNSFYNNRKCKKFSYSSYNHICRNLTLYVLKQKKEDRIREIKNY